MLPTFSSPPRCISILIFASFVITSATAPASIRPWLDRDRQPHKLEPSSRQHHWRAVPTDPRSLNSWGNQPSMYMKPASSITTSKLRDTTRVAVARRTSVTCNAMPTPNIESGTSLEASNQGSKEAAAPRGPSTGGNMGIWIAVGVFCAVSVLLGVGGLLAEESAKPSWEGQY
ncbi:hypothetical protein B0H65DRAFT_340545 [Neurospora tetraspora]|uniref:Uncharacterized protein n=1 Tax=Neurospora tetraspora TaxID=94610 RepID=A0AAE0MK23_9PEZI|nr:hypothetical protein B0H65DRAFT_340545 [Neurospora tetraspora]